MEFTFKKNFFQVKVIHAQVLIYKDVFFKKLKDFRK
jgi:hypothetical protein